MFRSASGRFCQLGVLFVGVLKIECPFCGCPHSKGLLFGVYIKSPDFWKPPFSLIFLVAIYIRIYIYIYVYIEVHIIYQYEYTYMYIYIYIDMLYLPFSPFTCKRGRGPRKLQAMGSRGGACKGPLRVIVGLYSVPFFRGTTWDPMSLTGFRGPG